MEIDEQEAARRKQQDATVFENHRTVMVALMVMIPHAARLAGLALPRDVRSRNAPQLEDRSLLLMGTNLELAVVNTEGYFNIRLYLGDGTEFFYKRRVTTVSELAEIAVLTLHALLEHRAPSLDCVLNLAGYGERMAEMNTP